MKPLKLCETCIKADVCGLMRKLSEAYDKIKSEDPCFKDGFRSNLCPYFKEGTACSCSERRTCSGMETEKTCGCCQYLELFSDGLFGACSFHKMGHWPVRARTDRACKELMYYEPQDL